MEPSLVTGLYGEVSGLPAPVSAHSDLVRGSRLRYSQQWTLIADSNHHKSIRTVLPPGPCAPVAGELVSAISPIRGQRAVVRETSGHQLLEIWNHHGLRKCLNLTALKKHGRVYEDGSVGSGSQSVVFVGWYHEPFRLGLRFCSNRRSAIFKLDLDGNCGEHMVVVSGSDLSVSCPRLSPDGSTIVYLQGRDLYMVDRQSNKVTSLSDSLPDLSKVFGSWKLLTVQKDLMRVGFLPSAGEAVTWQTLQQPIMTVDLHWTVLDVTPPPEEDNTHYSGLDFGAVLVKPTRRLHETKIPLVVFIHGGPHSQFPAEWNSTTAGLAQLGFAVLMVNYRGSTGFGQDSILSLIGNIGTQDVKDVQRAVLTALQSDITLDPKRLAVIGGSHGGFLSCHLVGQYPEFYRACAARNPVINAATLLGTSDIVDWRYSSVGLQYSYDQIPTAEALAAMLEKSPITHAAQIKAPVLLMLGGKDRRVSPHQGLELYKALKSRASPVRLTAEVHNTLSISGLFAKGFCSCGVEQRKRVYACETLLDMEMSRPWGCDM
ncbi:hypothetical protein F7725_000449 [Dissostichus mawsoni]|uniref:acylaminoacyl-peptidase n=1 Tax=Dissostichus mawsoni TaxID=36200 RepID=A0A7J5ZEF3_DISMA|nr:hypothetical protein F7725_000449 [Dissostichus mawsoni]